MGAVSTRSLIELRRRRDEHAVSRWKGASSHSLSRRHEMLVVDYDLDQMSDAAKEVLRAQLERAGIPSEALESLRTVSLRV